MKIFTPSVKVVVRKILKEENQSCDEVSIYFVETPSICHLHKQFFNDPSPTDCISFPMDKKKDETGYCLLGEVFVCPQTAIAYAEAHKKDPYDEIALYVIHGLLHLIGYDDIKKKDRELMRQKERYYMSQLEQLHLSLNPHNKRASN